MEMFRKLALILFVKESAIWTALLLVIVSSCIPTSPKSNRSSSSQQSGANPGNNPPGDPVFNDQLNFFQNGSIQSSSTFSLNIDYGDSYYLRGPEIDNFLGLDNNTEQVHCLVSYFPTSTTNKLLVTAATAGNFYNFQTQSQEDYLLLSPNAKNTNQTFCQTSGLITALSLDPVFSGASIAYDFLSVCPACQISQFTSLPLAMYDINGIKISLIDISYMNLRMVNSPASQIPIGSSCSSSNECLTKGFDCCSTGQCVNDLEQRSGINTSSPEYLQAAQEIINNSSSIYNYPNFFHICSVAPGATVTPTPIVDQEREAYLRFLEKQELFECSIPIKGEMSLCTVTIPDVGNDATDDYYTGPDDRSFYTTYTGTTGIPQHSIDRITHADEVLFANNTFISPTVEIGLLNTLIGNDNLNDSLRIGMTHIKSVSAPDDNLKIRFKVDGSCEQITTNLAKCKKYYLQGQNTGDVDDHFPASNLFVLPFYADINKTIQVAVDDTPRLQGSSWSLLATSPAQINFLGTGLQIFDTQEIVISYFVDTSVNPVLTTRQDALLRIKQMCGCADTRCRLTPKYQAGSTTNIEDYICLYPPPNLPPPPLQQTVFMSTKTVPHRYFDDNGVSQSEFNIETPPQEGLEFEYTGGDLLKPNNLTGYIGFNEIMGSFTTKVGSAKPALEVRIEKGKTYDIFTNSGSYSTCFFCGTDYYTNIAKLFPSNFTSNGSGYIPDPSISSKFNTTLYRADDLLFGRACFVPASMLPWGHGTASDRQQQRIKRLQSQHFLFANGYQRDWFGFDYGALIGSFDGVAWFAIGNQRRIQAATNKLYLALNQSFGDLASEGTYSITVSASSTTPSAGSLITSDFDSDGAECQAYHVCNTDSDCARQLGWDYVCEAVTNVSSRWPSFDTNALELPETEIIKKLMLINGTSNGSASRCVYRGRGAPCVADFDTVNANISYSGTNKPGIHMCSANNYCQQFVDGIPRATFNNKIARYGKSVKVQNASPTVPESNLHEFGMGVRSIGRPYSYSGTDTIPVEAQAGLSNNNISAICIPGRNPDDSVTLVRNSHGSLPSAIHSGDVVTGIGMTPTGVGPLPHYLSSCSIFGPDDNYILKTSASLVLSDALITGPAKQFSIATNSLSIFTDEALVGQPLNADFDVAQVTSPIYQKNRCLKAPGAACFTDLDCAPNNLISSKVNNVSEDGSNDNIINKYEIKFWKEKLICSQEKKPADPDFDLKNNKCCRELGNTISIGTAYLSPSSPIPPSEPHTIIDNISTPGVEIGLGESDRYSRMSTIRDKTSSINFISAPGDDRCSGGACDNDSGDAIVDWGVSTNDGPRSIATSNQWKLIDDMATRTCCSGNWVRNFHSLNGGGHVWGPLKHQNVDSRIFKCINWAMMGASPINSQFTCASSISPFDFSCKMRATTDANAEKIFDAMNKLELMGIPQIRFTAENELAVYCNVNPDDQNSFAGLGAGADEQRLNIANNNPSTVIREVVKWTTAPDSDPTREAVGEYFKSPLLLDGLFGLHDETNFDDNFIPRFSEDEFSCCKPPGETLDASEDASICCTGVINPQTNNCALPDFANVSLFYNRYVSSGAKGLDASLFDEETGFIKSPNIVETLACTQNICNSGVLGRGVAHSNLRFVGHETNILATKRFIDGDNQSNNFSGLADFYNAGLRWNNDLYCVPLAVAQSGAPLQLVDCSLF
jgi:hypothetical protein